MIAVWTVEVGGRLKDVIEFTAFVFAFAVMMRRSSK